MIQKPWTASEELTEAVSLALQRLAVLSDEDLIDSAFQHFNDVSLTESLILLELFSRVSPAWEARELSSRTPVQSRQSKRSPPVLSRVRVR